LKTVYLLRHAKSNWADPNQIDKDRVLADRGVKDAVILGSYVKKNNLNPNIIYCSTAQRCKQTLALVNLDSNIEKKTIIYDDDLYGCHVSFLLNILLHQDKEINSILLVNHEPTLSDLVNSLVPRNKILETDYKKYNTCGFSILKYMANDWSNINQENLASFEFVIPKNL